MKIEPIEKIREQLQVQFCHPNWQGGLSPDELKMRISELESANRSRAWIKAESFALILEHGQIAVDPHDIFQDKVNGRYLLEQQRMRWHNEVANTYFPNAPAEFFEVQKNGIMMAGADYGHLSPSTRDLVTLGLPGLLSRVRCARDSKSDLTEAQDDFYRSCIRVFEAMLVHTKRLADAIRPYHAENAACLDRLTVGAPQTMYDAMQLVILYFFWHEWIGGSRVRTLGRLDQLFWPFYERDLQNGTLTRDSARTLWHYFLHKFWIAKVDYDLPFALGGITRDGMDAINDLSYLIVEAYNDLDIYSPKIHIRVSEKSDANFLRLILRSIRSGHSSFVFVYDRVAIQALERVGIDPQDVWDYVLIGCYEPAIWGREVPCTGNGYLNLPKVMDFVMQADIYTTYEDFCMAIKDWIRDQINAALTHIVRWEGYYGDVTPDPILSGMNTDCLAVGKDAYLGGAKYNNSSFCVGSLASLVDAMLVVKRFVFTEKRVSFSEFSRILRLDWDGFEVLRQEALHLPEKYGNGNGEADALATELLHFMAGLINHKPNGRGGVFKMSCFTIDHCFSFGKKTGATPDGRHAGDPLSKNLCAVTAMDRKGLTALISSVTAMDLAEAPNGSVLDLCLHPSAVQGACGLDAMFGILKTYFSQGGFALHGNVFRSEDLRAAQKEPEKYATLQVRVCGWNAYFVNLSKPEQDDFIRQCEHVS